MNEEKLRNILKRLEKETKDMNDEETETYYRAVLMDHFSTGEIE